MTSLRGKTKTEISNNVFAITKAPRQSLGPRLGKLSLPGKKAIDTPHYLGNTSRGVVPHITQDNFQRHTFIKGVYVGLEDFVERAPQAVPPIYQISAPDGSSSLRRFIALPDETILVLGARRIPPVTAPAANSNTNETISISTAVGFKALYSKDYTENSEKLKPDVVIALGDIQHGRTLVSKRIEKATDRCIQWLQDHRALRKSLGEDCQTTLFATMLPVSCAKQQYYVDFLVEDAVADISGLCVYGLETLEDMPASLGSLPRLAFTAPESPHELLRQISLGLDIFIIPFISAVTDAGIALHFAFPVVETPGSEPLAPHNPKTLGVDMWSESHAADLSKLMDGCECYACTSHHRAFVQHLLSAKEMLGWVLLQIHNHHVMDNFFAGIRESISKDKFDHDTKDFQRFYIAHLPEKTGQGPRVRGYQFKSEGPGEPKKNPSPFTVIDDGKQKLAEAIAPDISVDMDRLKLENPS